MMADSRHHWLNQQVDSETIDCNIEPTTGLLHSDWNFLCFFFVPMSVRRRRLRQWGLEDLFLPLNPSAWTRRERKPITRLGLSINLPIDLEMKWQEAILQQRRRRRRRRRWALYVTVTTRKLGVSDKSRASYLFCNNSLPSTTLLLTLAWAGLTTRIWNMALLWAGLAATAEDISNLS